MNEETQYLIALMKLIDKLESNKRINQIDSPDYAISTLDKEEYSEVLLASMMFSEGSNKIFDADAMKTFREHGMLKFSDDVIGEYVK